MGTRHTCKRSTQSYCVSMRIFCTRPLVMRLSAGRYQFMIMSLSSSFFGARKCISLPCFLSRRFLHDHELLEFIMWCQSMHLVPLLLICHDQALHCRGEALGSDA